MLSGSWLPMIIILFWWFTAGIALKIRKGWPNFVKFQSMSILAIRCNRRQETVSMAKYSLKKQNWNIIFEIKLKRRHSVSLFKKIANRVEIAPLNGDEIFIWESSSIWVSQAEKKTLANRVNPFSRKTQLFQLSIHVHLCHPLQQTTKKVSMPKYNLKKQKWAISFLIKSKRRQVYNFLTVKHRKPQFCNILMSYKLKILIR